MKLQAFVIFAWLEVLNAATKKKPHGHQGVLPAYDGKHIAYSITKEQTQKLDGGEPVVINERSGKSGRGIVLQDINASPEICMSNIRDLANYKNVVPKVKSIDIYSEEIFSNSTMQQGALFNVGISFLSFGYYLLLTFEPKYYTYTWTLDYKYNSDFDDNTGHWQVMPHPKKEGWTRVLYSTEVRLFPWIPEFVVTFLTKTALVESTTWVKRESEKQATTGVASGSFVSAAPTLPDLRACFVEDAEGSRYLTHCSEGPVETAPQGMPTQGEATSTTLEEVPTHGEAIAPEEEDKVEIEIKNDGNGEKEEL